MGDLTMPSRHENRKTTCSLALALFLTGVTSGLNAQTQEFHEGLGPLPSMTAQEVQKSLMVLNAPVDVNEFQTNLNLKEILGQLYDQLAEAGIEFPILVDTNAFLIEDSEMDPYSAPINLSNFPDRITAGKFLREVLKQLPGKNAEVMVHPGGWFEITTNKAMEERRLAVPASWNPLGWLLGRKAPSEIPLSDLEGSPLGTVHLLGGVAVLCGVIGAIVWLKKRKRLARNRLWESILPTGPEKSNASA
jgi:hypothetical protein